MKPSTPRFAYLARPCGVLVLAAATLAGAQAPAPAPASAGPAPAAAPAPGTVPAAAPAAPPDTSPEHTGYLFGLTFGEQMHAVGITNQIDVDAITRGLKDGLQGKKSTRADQQQIQSYVHSVMLAESARNKAAGQEFLSRNGKDKSVKTTASGLEYKVLSPGDTKAGSPQPTDEVSVNYRGKLLDGTEFDSSYARGMPATFRINGVIKGWQEALPLMKPGAKWQLFIPADLAYGDSPRPGIPAGSVLTFDIELLSVKPSVSPPQPQSQPLPQSQSPPSHRAVPPTTPTPNP